MEENYDLDFDQQLFYVFLCQLENRKFVSGGLISNCLEW